MPPTSSRKQRHARRGALLCLSLLLFFDAARPAAETAEEAGGRASNLHRWGAVTLFHGMPSDRVRAVAQGEDGAMWFGTDAGLARYDGRRIQTASVEGMAARRVLALDFDEEGALWVGTDGGAFVRLPSGEFRALAETTGKRVTAIATPERGRVLLATGDGIIFESRKDEGGALRLVTFAEAATRARTPERGSGAAPTREPGPPELTSLAVAAGKVIAGTRGRGLLSVEDGALQEVLTRPRPFFVESLAQDGEGNLFVGAQAAGADSGLFRFGDAQTYRPAKLPGTTGAVTALAFGERGDLFAGTDGRGVFRYRDGRLAERFTFAGTAGGLRSDRIYAVFLDREGVVWFGTDRGVCRYDPHGVEVESLPAETEGNFVRSIYRTRAGRLLAGTNRGLYVRDARTFSWRAVEEVAGKTVYAIAEDRAGALLVGTGSGLYVGLQMEARRLAPAVSPEPEEKTQEDAAAKGAAGGEGRASRAGPEDQAIAAAAGVEAKDSEGEDLQEPPAKKAPEPALRGSVRAVAVFGDKVYVAAFGRGLERLDGTGRRTLVWPKTGDDQRGREAVSLYADETGGKLWIGTANAGAFYFDGREVKADAALAPLGTSTVWGMSVAGDWLWLATGRGLYARAVGGQLLEIAPGLDARSVVAIQHPDRRTPQAWCATAGSGVLKAVIDAEFGALTARLDAERGLPSQNAFAVLPLAAEDGRDVVDALLIGTTKGLARYEPGNAPPSLALTRVTASRTHQPEELRGRVLTLEYPQSGLVVDVAANASRTFPEQFQYAFLLEDGAGRAIRKRLSQDSQLQVESLPAGRYRITARAYTIDLTPSSPLHFEFEVARAPFPWTTLSLSVLLALALVALLWGYVQHRRIVRSGAQLLEANRQLAAARLQLANEAESERRRIARDLHDQTLADLRRLLLLTDEMHTVAAASNGGGDAAATAVDPSELRAEIESISHEVRRICEDLSPSVLENVGFAAALEWSLASALAHLPADCKFDYDFVCDENLEERLRLAPGVQMQIYRIVQEAVSNICRHSGAARVRLSLHATEEGDFRLRLEDDGRGFDPSHKTARAGRGLAGIRARAHMIDAEVHWNKREESEGGGTVFTLRKPGAASDAANHDASA